MGNRAQSSGDLVSMPQAALGLLQQSSRIHPRRGSLVSMPQAALGLLQPVCNNLYDLLRDGFDAASGIRSVATFIRKLSWKLLLGFDAASGIRSVAT